MDSLLLGFTACFYLAGWIAALHAIMNTRTPQGTVAWVVSLIMLPYIALPAYLIFGRTNFRGFVVTRQRVDAEILGVGRALLDALEPFIVVPDPTEPVLVGLVSVARQPPTRQNAVALLIDGHSTYTSMLEGLEAARDYILFQFYIVQDDRTGERFRKVLMEKARSGVRVFFLYDEVGVLGASRRVLSEMRQAGVEVSPFNTTQGRLNRFQINFRNHRKVIVIDGRAAWVGGLNIGDEYLGLDPTLGPWRDTHLRIEGPSVQGVQMGFLADWYFATRRTPDLTWEPEPAHDGDAIVLPYFSNPADRIEEITLLFLQSITAARKRLWIASPYFVPDPGIVSALQLAAFRGVDVRVLIAGRSDNLMVHLSSFSFLEQMADAGVKVFRYESGMLHQKVFLVDDLWAAVGTANMDNRSFRLNFELMMLVSQPQFVRDIEAMLVRDFEACALATASDYRDRPLWFRLAVRGARLMAPLQ